MKNLPHGMVKKSQKQQEKSKKCLCYKPEKFTRCLRTPCIYQNFTSLLNIMHQQYSICKDLDYPTFIPIYQMQLIHFIIYEIKKQAFNGRIYCPFSGLPPELRMRTPNPGMRTPWQTCEIYTQTSVSINACLTFSILLSKNKHF